MVISMDKKTIIKEINKLKLDKNEFWVLGSSALVLRDIINDANDIDLAITSKSYEKLKHKLIYLGTNHDSKWYKIDDNIECCIEEFDKEKVEITEPFNLINLNYYYNNFIKNSTRPKDIKKKEILDSILNTK